MEEFEKLAEKLIMYAENVDCSMERFLYGLDTIRKALQDRIDLEE